MPRSQGQVGSLLWTGHPTASICRIRRRSDPREDSRSFSRLGTISQASPVKIAGTQANYWAGVRKWLIWGKVTHRIKEMLAVPLGSNATQEPSLTAWGSTSRWLGVSELCWAPRRMALPLGSPCPSPQRWSEAALRVSIYACFLGSLHVPCSSPECFMNCLKKLCERREGHRLCIIKQNILICGSPQVGFLFWVRANCVWEGEGEVYISGIIIEVKDK